MCGADMKPSFHADNKPNLNVIQGRSAYLVCRVNDIGNKTVSWIRHENLAILGSGDQSYGDDRFVLYHQPGSGEWVLKIKFVRTTDSGVYECQVPTTPPIGFTINLNVIVPETHIFGGKEFFVDIGSTLNLTCTVQNSPEPADYVFWYHNNSAIDYHSSNRISITIEKNDVTTSYLVVTRAIATDSGIYACSPSNSEPTNVKVHVLKVEIPAAMQTNKVNDLRFANIIAMIPTLAMMAMYSVRLLS